MGLVFNNAGFILTGFFHTVPLDKIRAHLECNAVAAVQITHHFLSRMIENKLRGAIVFTSSASAYMPGPFAITYASTKAMVSAFAASLAVEARAKVGAGLAGSVPLFFFPPPFKAHMEG